MSRRTLAAPAGADPKSSSSSAVAERVPPKRELVKIRIADVKPHPSNPRGKIADEDVAELAGTIREIGLLALPGVVEIDGDLCCLYGHRRLRALALNGLEETDAFKFEPFTDPAIAEAMIVADNAHHIAPDPIAEAIVVRDLLKTKSEAEIARLTGKSPRWVAVRAALSTLSAKVLNATLRPHKPARGNQESTAEVWPIAAVEALALESSEKRQLAIIDAFKYQGVPNSGNVRAEVMRDKRDLKSAPWALDDATLCPKDGACSSCPRTSASKGLLFHDEDRSAKDAPAALCLDGSCWDRKLAARLKSQLAEVEEKAGKKLPLALAKGIERHNPPLKLDDRRVFGQYDYDSRAGSFRKKAVQVAMISPSGVKAATVYIQDASPASSNRPGGRAKKPMAKLSPAAQKKRREERADQRARAASLDHVLELAKKVETPEPWQTIAAVLLFGGRQYGTDETYHREKKGDGAVRDELLKSIASCRGKRVENLSTEAACKILWSNSIEQLERILSRRDSQSIDRAIRAAEGIAAIVHADFDGIVKSKRAELEANKNKTKD